MRQRRYFQIPTGFNFLKPRSSMNNSKVVIFMSCLFAATLTVPLVTAAGHGGFSGGHSFDGRPGMGMRGRLGMGMPGRPGMGMRGAFMPRSMARMPMQRAPMMNSTSGLRRFGDRDFNRDDRFRRFNHFNETIFIGDFGFPWWWGWGWGPW